MRNIRGFLKKYEHLYFSPSEQKVFDFLLESDEITSAKNISYNCNVSPSAVSSFIRKIGYSNYTSFTFYLREYLNKPLNTYQLSSYLENKKKIDNLYNKIDIKVLNTITTEIIKYNKVIFFDTDNNYPFQDLTLRLRRLDIQIIYINDKEDLDYVYNIDKYYFLSFELFYKIGKFENNFEQIIGCDLVYNNVYNIYSYKNDITIKRLISSEKNVKN